MKEVLGWQSKEKEKNVRRRCSSWVFSSVAVCSAVVTSGRYSVLQQATKTGDNKARQDESSSFC